MRHQCILLLLFVGAAVAQTDPSATYQMKEIDKGKHSGSLVYSWQQHLVSALCAGSGHGEVFGFNFLLVSCDATQEDQLFELRNMANATVDDKTYITFQLFQVANNSLYVS